MLPVSVIREDLKEIKYYYSRKELFEDSFKHTGTNDIVEKANKYNMLITKASPKLYELYVELYINNHTQESFADKLCYSTEYVQLLNRKLLKFLQMSMEEENKEI